MKFFIIFIVIVIGLTPVHAITSPGNHGNITQVQCDSSISSSVISESRIAADARSFYSQWKKRYIKQACTPGEYYVYFDEHPGFSLFKPRKICVSEGQGYGMLIMACMADEDSGAHRIFDGLYRFYKDHTSNNGSSLMSWQEVTGCQTSPLDSSSASDGDIDIAYALILAGNHWGNTGTIPYLSEAKNLINDIAAYEINHKSNIVMLGDWLKQGDVSDHITRSSDFMPDHFREFFAITGDSVWLRVIDSEYAIFSHIQQKYSKNTGLIPDFIETNNHNPRPAKKQILESDYDGDYYYNACRVPLRLACDYMLYKDPRANKILTAMNQWFITHTHSDPEALKSGYKLSGKDIRGSNYTCPAFVGPITVSAFVSPSGNKFNWPDDLYSSLMNMKFDKNRYYDNTLKMISLMILSGFYTKPSTGD